MSKILTVVLGGFLMFPFEITARQRTYEIERVSVIRASIPVTVRMPAGLWHLDGAVDEAGNIYVSFSLWRAASERGGPIKTAPYLIKYNQAGEMMRMFPLPEKTEIVTSIAYREGRVYVSAVEGGRGRILTFDSTGELKQVINLNDLLPHEVEPSTGGSLYVLAADHDSQRILKLSPSGETLTSWLSAAGETQKGFSFPQRSFKPVMAIDESGHAIYVLHSGEIQVLDPKGAGIRTLRKEGAGLVSSAFCDGKDLVFVRRESGRTFIAFLGERGDLYEREITGQLSPMFKGSDGYYYGLGLLGIPPNTSAAQFEILVAKFRMQKSLASTR